MKSTAYLYLEERLQDIINQLSIKYDIQLEPFKCMVYRDYKILEKPYNPVTTHYDAKIESIVLNPDFKYITLYLKSSKILNLHRLFKRKYRFIEIYHPKIILKYNPGKDDFDKIGKLVKDVNFPKLVFTNFKWTQE